jgi:SAM-dependent MidA family methyltransferase
MQIGSLLLEHQIEERVNFCHTEAVLSKSVAEACNWNSLVTQTATILRQEIERTGVISFARFMEVALYCPDCGYYQRIGSPIGREGDFYTSVSTGGFFGKLLAIQFAQWLETGIVGPRQLVEIGAHDAQLASDILDSLCRQYPGLLERLEYWIVEPSEKRQIRQRKKLEQFAGHVRWANSLQDLGDAVIGVIFSNELLDALPVHRLAWDHPAGKWFEWGVGLAGDRFVWRRMPASLDREHMIFHQAGLPLCPELNAVLPDGFILDLCPSAAQWWHQAASRLRQGRLMTIDYGLAAEQFIAPERAEGTLRAYYQHRLSPDLLARPGEQDLTAHVNFTQLQMAGEEAGLRTDEFCPQAQFLTNIASRVLNSASDLHHLTPSGARQFHTLTHPEHLGRSFRVLVQSKGC